MQAQLGWLFLSFAILFEVAGTTATKLSKGFTVLTPSILLFIFYGFALALNTLAMRTIELSIAYAIWAGVGTAITTGIGILYFKEPATAMKLVSISLIIFGVVGLHMAQGNGQEH